MKRTLVFCFASRVTSLFTMAPILTVAAFDSATSASHGFDYTNTCSDPGWHDTGPDYNFQVIVPLLKGVTMPEGELYEVVRDSQPPNVTDCSTSGRVSGKISGIRLPGGGQIEWEDTVRSFPTVDIVNSSTPIKDMTRTSGVAIRQELDPTDVDLGTWHCPFWRPTVHRISQLAGGLILGDWVS